MIKRGKGQTLNAGEGVWAINRRPRKRGCDSEVVLANKERNMTALTGLVSHVVDSAVVRMIQIACLTETVLPK